MNAHHLHDQAWLTAPQTLAVIAALEAAGGADCARFVGGCVRNAVMGRPIDDVDIATVLTPEQSAAALAAAGLRWVPTGMDHGTVTAISGGRPFEITTLRRDVSTDGRRAVVAFTTDWAEDAQRRDFQFNALYATWDGEIVDPTGRGLDDALAGRVVFVGDPMQRIAEDYLRILRYFRFLAWYGRGDPDPAALAACEAQKAMLAKRTPERTQKEILKLLAAPDPLPALNLMAETGILNLVLPVSDLDGLGRLIGLERQRSWPADALLRLAALLLPGMEAARTTARLLRLSNAQRDRLIAARGDEVAGLIGLTRARQVLYRIGRQAFEDQARLAWANGASGNQDWTGLLSLAASWSPPTFPLTGGDVLAEGLAPGPQVGDILDQLQAWWIDQDFHPDRTALMARLQSAVRASPDRRY
ncbi:MAG: Polynucleotide adenylyltransferase region [Caulobacteraceae bacterium]|nr:Polynucleotide adenylyltransferase region [Caulobacteraceae bacterium]